MSIKKSHKKYILTDDMELQEDISLPNYQIDFVRKKYEDSAYGRRERKIVEIIYRKQNEGLLKNIVKILNITDSYYDQEYLTTIDNLDFLTDKGYNKLSRDLSKAIEQLHSVCIIYIDLHMYNIGYSNVDDKFKIFDFNMSGTVEDKGDECDYTKWDSKPFAGILMNNADNYILNELCKGIPNCKSEIEQLTKQIYLNFEGKPESVIKKKLSSEISKLCRKNNICFANFENLDKREFDFYLKILLLNEIFSKKHKPSTISKFRNI